MRDKLAVFAVVALVAVVAMAALNTYDQNTYKTVLSPTVSAIDTVQTNGFVDIVGRKGIGAVVLAVGPASTNAANYGCTLKLQHCATTNGTYADVSGASLSSAGGLSVVKVDVQALNRYVRTISTATNDAGVCSAVLVYPK